MTTPPLVLCPIDFSNGSRAALRRAVAISERFDTRLMLLTVDDPILVEAAAATMGADWSHVNSERELRRFLDETLGAAVTLKSPPDFHVVVGKPAIEILRVASERRCDLIVMSTHGRSGASKQFFGSVAEGVLRETTLPVLLTPPHDTGTVTIDTCGPILVPVDFTEATSSQVGAARKVAEALKMPILFAHVIEAPHLPVPEELDSPELTANRVLRAQTALVGLGAATRAGIAWDTLIAVGRPANEIARIARERHAGLIVLGLHGPPVPGPRMGSVTYRVLCESSVLTLAWPPESRLANAEGGVLAGTGK